MSDGMMQAYRDGLESDALKAHRFAMLDYAASPSPELREKAIATFKEYNRDERYLPPVIRQLDALANRDRAAAMLAVSNHLAEPDYSEAGLQREAKAFTAIKRRYKFDPRKLTEFANGKVERLTPAINAAIMAAYPDHGEPTSFGVDRYVIEIPPEAIALMTITRIKKARRR